jgi:hypothetical protein
MIGEKTFIKLAYQLSLQQTEVAEDRLLKQFKILIELVKV